MRRITSISFVFCTFLLISMSWAQQPASTAVPNLIRYGGVLKDTNGAPIPATSGVTFAIYKQQEGGAPVWMETQNVTPDASGQYNVLLGSTTATGLPSDLFSQEEQRWLGVQVQGQSEQPRVLLVSVPYAMKAADADKLAGHSASEFVTTDSLRGAVQQQLQQGATASAIVLPGSGQTASANGPFVPTDGATNFVDNTTSQVVLVTQNGSGHGVKASATTGNAIYATSNAIAINAISNDTTGNSAGIRGYSAAPTGYGVFGQANSTTGLSYAVYGRANSTSGIGLRGAATATTGPTYGLLATSASPNGIAAQAWNTSATGSTFGLQGIVSSAAGTAGFFQNRGGGPLLVAVTGSSSPVTKFSVDGSGNVTSAGGFTGSGAGLTGLQFSQIGGLLGSAQFSGSYSHAVTLSNTANVFYGSGANLTGIVPGPGSPYYIQNGTAMQSGASFNIDGSAAVGRTFAANEVNVNDTLTANVVNATTTYQAGGAAILSGDANTIFIGVNQSATYIAGVLNNINPGGELVTIGGAGQLGIGGHDLQGSVEQIQNMGDSSSKLFQLRPVTFFYKAEYDHGSHQLQYGLIAEEVAKVYPDMVVYDKDARPHRVKYQYLAPMLLNELQKQHTIVAAQQDVIKTQQKWVDAQQQQIGSLQEQNMEFQQRLSRLETLVRAQVKITEDAAASAGPQ